MAASVDDRGSGPTSRGWASQGLARDAMTERYRPGGEEELEGLPTMRYERFREPHDTLRELAEGPVAEAEARRRPTRDSDPETSGLDSMDEPLRELHLKARERLGVVVAGRYALQRVLGTGAAGAVYAAKDVGTGQAVAVKVLHHGLRTSDEHVARFRREARAASAIGHSGIVTVLDVGREGDVYFMVMELLRGEALFYAIEERKLSDDDVREVALQLLGALGAAHARGIIHRDVKPENVFLTTDLSGALRVKLLDFGIAKFVRADPTRSFATTDGLLIGTPHYMSPQVCMGEQADERADLWAASAVIFHALARRPPYDDHHLGRLLMRIVREPAPSLADFRPDLPAHLVATVDRGLHRDPSQRYTSARELADALSASSADLRGLDWDEGETD